MAKSKQYLAVASVCARRAFEIQRHSDLADPGVTEDPSEFFGMIFGGEAFTDWSASASIRPQMSRRSVSLTLRIGLARSRS